METVQRISKPNLVDLLRMCDRRRWCTPRIRYASIRSKPDLCRDLVVFFEFKLQGDEVRILPKKKIFSFPDLRYNLKERRFYLDGQWFDGEGLSSETGVSSGMEDDCSRVWTGVCPSSTRKWYSLCFLCSVSITNDVQIGRFCKQYRAIRALWAYSVQRIWQSPDIGQENKNNTSRDRRQRLGSVV